MNIKFNKSEVWITIITVIFAHLLSIALLALACYFPCKWAFPDNYLTVSQWFMVVVITKILKLV